MSLGKWILLILGCAVVLLIGWIGYGIYALNSLGPCMLSSGPLKGRSIAAALDTLQADTSFHVDNGHLLLVHINDSVGNPNLPAPLLVKLDERNTLQWAMLFDSVGIGLSIDNASIDIDHRSIHFFNGEILEPATFYFDEDWNFKYMCQSVF